MQRVKKATPGKDLIVFIEARTQLLANPVAIAVQRSSVPVSGDELYNSGSFLVLYVCLWLAKSDMRHRK